MDDTGVASIEAVVYGRVQGVFFRAFVLRQARGLGLEGYVRNLPGGNAVEVYAEGGRDRLQALVGHLEAGPTGARVERVATNWSDYTGTYSGFDIRY